MARVRRITRRRALKVTAGAAGAALPLVHVQTAAAAGKLTMGVWDHWVPAANPVLKGLIDEWAAKNKVEVTIDFIPSSGNKIILTQAAEAQARSGHDILALDQSRSFYNEGIFDRCLAGLLVHSNTMHRRMIGPL